MKQFILLLSFIFLPPALLAQSFVQITSSPWYDPLVSSGELRCNTGSDPYAIDWDSDGDLDIVSGSGDADLTVCYFKNLGDSLTFSDYRLTSNENGGTAPAVIDWDEDGDQDIFLADGYTIYYYENTGGGFLAGGDEFEAPIVFLTFTHDSDRLEIVDWDEDGDLDFVAGESNNTLEYFENTGDDITFNHTVDWLGVEGDSNTSPAFGDLNEDGHVDLFLGTQIGYIAYYQNNGVGGFEDPIVHYQDIFTDGGAAGNSSPNLVDWDGDDHLDLLMGNTSGYISLYLNDWDEDTYVGSDDCNNDDATVNIAATEICDGIDNDCDGTIDENNTADGTTYYADADEDSFGNPDSTIITCDITAPTGYVTDNTDCNDTSAAANPDGTEICDNLDNDCNGTVDESTATDAPEWYQDADGDGLGNAAVAATSCNAPTNFIAADAVNPDCDDTDAGLTTDCPAGDDDTTGDDDATGDDDDTTASSGGCGLQGGERSNSPISLAIGFYLFALLIFRSKIMRFTHS